NGREINLQFNKFGEVGGFIFGNELSFEDQPQPLAIATGAHLTFNNVRGDIEVNSSPQSQATARINKRIRAATEEDAKERAKKILLQVASEEGNYQFSVNPGGNEQDFSATIIVTLPQQLVSHLEINNTLGNIKLHDLHGNHTIRDGNRIEVQRNAGSVKIENPRGEVELKQIQNEVTVTNARHSVTVQDAKGKVSLDLKGGNLTAENIAGPLEIRANGARLEIHNIGSESVEQPIPINLSEIRNCRISLQDIKG